MKCKFCDREAKREGRMGAHTAPVCASAACGAMFEISIVRESESFDNLMRTHVRLTVNYAEAAYSHRVTRTEMEGATRREIRRNEPVLERLEAEMAATVNWLVSNMAQWQEKLAAYESDEPWFDGDDTSSIFYEHTLAAKDLIDRAMEDKDTGPAMNALATNADRVGAFFRNEPFAPYADRIAELWGTHLECTAEYVSALKTTGRSEEYKTAVRGCLEAGSELGRLLDVVKIN